MMGATVVILISCFLFQAEIVSLEIRPEPATVGDVVECSVRIRLPAGSRSPLVRGEDLRSSISSVRRISSFKEARFDLWEVRLRRSFFTPGEHRWPSVRFIWLNPDGTLGEMSLPPVRVEIASVLKRQVMGEMRMMDIKREMGDDIGAAGWLLGIGGIFVIIGAFLLVYLRVRPQEETRRLSPEDEALLNLAELKRSGLIERGAVREYCSAVAGLFREYLEKRFDLPVTPFTSSEIVRRLRGKGLKGEMLRGIEEVLLEIDRARFSSGSPSPEHAKEFARKAGELILELSKWQTDPADDPVRMTS